MTRKGMTRKGTLIRIGGVLMASGLVLAACSSTNNSGSGSTSTTTTAGGGGGSAASALKAAVAATTAGYKGTSGTVGPKSRPAAQEERRAPRRSSRIRSTTSKPLPTEVPAKTQRVPVSR